MPSDTNPSPIPPYILRKLTPVGTSASSTGHGDRRAAIQRQRADALKKKTLSVQEKSQAVNDRKSRELCDLKNRLTAKRELARQRHKESTERIRDYASRFCQNYAKFLECGFFTSIHDYRAPVTLPTVKTHFSEPKNKRERVTKAHRCFNTIITYKDLLKSLLSLSDKVHPDGTENVLRQKYFHVMVRMTAKISDALCLTLPKRLCYTGNEPGRVLLAAICPLWETRESPNLIKSSQEYPDFMKLLQLSGVDCAKDEFWANYNDEAFFSEFLVGKVDAAAKEVSERLLQLISSNRSLFSSAKTRFWGAWRRYVDVLDIEAWESLNIQIITLLRLRNLIVAEYNFTKFIKSSPRYIEQQRLARASKPKLPAYDDSQDSHRILSLQISESLKQLVSFKHCIIQKPTVESESYLLAGRDYKTRLNIFYKEYLEVKYGATNKDDHGLWVSGSLMKETPKVPLFSNPSNGQPHDFLDHFIKRSISLQRSALALLLSQLQSVPRPPSFTEAQYLYCQKRKLTEDIYTSLSEACEEGGSDLKYSFFKNAISRNVSKNEDKPFPGQLKTGANLFRGRRTASLKNVIGPPSKKVALVYDAACHQVGKSSLSDSEQTFQAMAEPFENAHKLIIKRIQLGIAGVSIAERDQAAFQIEKQMTEIQSVHANLVEIACGIASLVNMALPKKLDILERVEADDSQLAARMWKELSASCHRLLPAECLEEQRQLGGYPNEERRSRMIVSSVYEKNVRRMTNSRYMKYCFIVKGATPFLLCVTRILRFLMAFYYMDHETEQEIHGFLEYISNHRSELRELMRGSYDFSRLDDVYEGSGLMENMLAAEEAVNNISDCFQKFSILLNGFFKLKFRLECLCEALLVWASYEQDFIKQRALNKNMIYCGYLSNLETRRAVQLFENVAYEDRSDVFSVFSEFEYSLLFFKGVGTSFGLEIKDRETPRFISSEMIKTLLGRYLVASLLRTFNPVVFLTVGDAYPDLTDIPEVFVGNFAPEIDKMVQEARSIPLVAAIMSFFWYADGISFNLMAHRNLKEVTGDILKILINDSEVSKDRLILDLIKRNCPIPEKTEQLLESYIRSTLERKERNVLIIQEVLLKKLVEIMILVVYNEEDFSIEQMFSEVCSKSCKKTKSNVLEKLQNILQRNFPFISHLIRRLLLTFIVYCMCDWAIHRELYFTLSLKRGHEMKKNMELLHQWKTSR